MLEKNLKRMREEANLTQAELAEKAGVTQAMISLYEKGYKMPGVLVLKRMAGALGRSVDELLAG